MSLISGKIIGLTGKAGSGKDTVAGHLVNTFPRQFRTVAFADAIRDGLKAIFGLTQQQLTDRVLKEQILESIGKSPRNLAQTLGTEWGREQVNENLWVIIAGQRIKVYTDSGFDVLVTDVRFENEASWIRDNGGEIWHLGRDEAGTGNAATNAHASEAGIAFVEGDKKLGNNNTIGWLWHNAEILAREIIAERLAAEAVAA